MADPQTARDYQRFKDLTFDGFRELARDPNLSPYQRIGFPDSYRKGIESTIFQDIVRKLPALDGDQRTILDIGPGCSDLPKMLIEKATERNHRLVLVDSVEMLDLLPGGPSVRKIPGRFPLDTPDLVSEFTGQVDAIICYSVLHYIFVEQSLFGFLDALIGLLAPGGRCLIGDIPNVSKRRRFFASATGVRYHQAYTGTDEIPTVSPFTLEPDKIDDGVLLGIVSRYRAAGFDAYVLPQDETLPMANRREDLLVIRP